MPDLTSPDLLVEQIRPIVADLLGPGRMGLGTLLEPADPMVIVDGVPYRLDAGMSAGRASSAERVREAKAVDFRDASRFLIERPAHGANVIDLVADAIGPLPPVLAVELLGVFSDVAVPGGLFGRTVGSAVGFVTGGGVAPHWQLTFLTADRTFGGPILELSIDSAQLRILAPPVVYQAGAPAAQSVLPDI